MFISVAQGKYHSHSIRASLVALRLLCITSYSLLLVSLIACDASESTGLEVPQSVDKQIGHVNKSPTEFEAYEQASRNGNVMSLLTNRCAIPDPAVDAWFTGEGLIKPALVPEIHAGLMEFTENPASPVIPALASSYTKTPDGKTYRFHLREGLKFSDGTDLTASDVKWSWERALAMSTGTSRANAVFGNVVGAEQFELTGVQVVDQHTLRVDLTSPNADFAVILADPVASVLKSGNVEAWDGLWSNLTDHFIHSDAELIGAQLPVGAGPFKLTRYHVGRDLSECVLERNDHYWNGPVSLDGIVLSASPFVDASDSVAVYAKAENQFAGSSIDVYPFLPRQHELSSAMQDSPKEYGFASPINALFIAFNTDYPPFDDRQRREVLVNAVQLSLGRIFDGHTIAHRILEPSWHETVPISITPWVASDEIPEHQLFARNRPPDLDLAVINDRHYYHSQEVLLVLDEWHEKLDLLIFHDVLSPDAFMVELNAGRVPARALDFTINAPLIAPQYMQIVDAFGSENPPLEYAILRNMLAEAEQTLDDVEKLARFSEIEEFILNERLVLPLIWDQGSTTVLLQSWVNGLRSAPYPRSIFRDVWFGDEAPIRSFP